MARVEEPDIPGIGKIAFLGSVNVVGIFSLAYLLLGTELWLAAVYGLVAGGLIFGYLLWGRRRALREHGEHGDRVKTRQRTRR